MFFLFCFFLVSLNIFQFRLTSHKYSFVWPHLEYYGFFDFVNARFRGTISGGRSSKHLWRVVKVFSSSAPSPAPTLSSPSDGGGEINKLLKNSPLPFLFPPFSVFGGCYQHSGPGAIDPATPPSSPIHLILLTQGQNSG